MCHTRILVKPNPHGCVRTTRPWSIAVAAFPQALDGCLPSHRRETCSGSGPSSTRKFDTLACLLAQHCKKPWVWLAIVHSFWRFVHASTPSFFFTAALILVLWKAVSEPKKGLPFTMNGPDLDALFYRLHMLKCPQVRGSIYTLSMQ